MLYRLPNAAVTISVGTLVQKKQLKVTLEDADRLLSIYSSDYNETMEYQLLVHGHSEQTVMKRAVRCLHIKESEDLHSSMLQNLSNPVATFQTKVGKGY